MYRRGSRAQQTMIIKQLGRSATVESLSSNILSRLLAEMNMQWPLPCCLGNAAQRYSGHGPDRVHCDANMCLIKIAEQAYTSLPVINIAVSETALD